ncbi:muscle M-line assembly protein unc-89-like [Uloborus diversus]|uniref:muscle M-line assembly protein unc-89-like n=1 Tax=Uloborus diversus TaxID=327109 RepID=UPI00240A18E0|nr:muscle M-line assembly protein unc-89-like [Uloborus diversus]
MESSKWEYRTEEDGDSLTLILKRAENEDAGEYSCTISNEKGSATSRGKLCVTEAGTTPAFRKQLGNLSAIEEENIDLEVQFEGLPKPKVEWKKDDSEIVIDDDHYEVTSTQDSETLTINNVTVEDAGKYSCTLSNDSGSVTTSGDVTVKESTSAPKIVQGLKDQTVGEDQPVKMTVKFTGKPKPVPKWTKDGAELSIVITTPCKVEEDEASFTLVIPHASQSHGGTYACTITNKLGSDTTSAKLTVSESTFAPEFTQKLSDKEVKENGTVEFTVKFTGKPKPTAKWTLDGAELTLEAGHTELKVEEDGASLTLVLSGATREDVGKYACTITNELGSQTTAGRLTITAAPRFLKELEDKEGEEGVPLKLNVKFEGQPDPKTAWKKDGVPLDLTGGHFKTTIESDDSLTLLIDKLNKQDAGKFTCEISNSHGSASTSAVITVTGKPVIKKGLQDKDVLEGEADVTLTVEVTGTPAPEIKWFLNGKELADDEDFQLTKDSERGTYSLKLKKAAGLDNVGEVRLEASNSGGKAETKASLRLLTKPVFTKDLLDVTLVEGDELKLDTAVKGSPTPEVKWMFGKKEIRSDDRSVVDVQGDVRKLTIREARVEDSGNYTCKATNKAGEASQKATVTVKSKKDTQAPQFLTPLHDLVIVVGDAARFETRVTGKPQPQVTWYRGSDELSAGDLVLIRSDPQDFSHTLTLKDLKVEDSSEYSCKATNEYGEAQEKAKLTVKEPVAPQVEDLQDQQVRYGAPVRLKAKISGFPTPNIKWLKDGQPIPIGSDRFEITSEPEKRHFSLGIKSVTKDEVGSYTCTATNDAGTASAQCAVSIKAQAPAFARDPKDQSAELGEEFKFEAEIYAFPPPEVTWFKDNKPFEGASATSDGDVYRLTGRISDVGDAGTVKCKAKNEAGEDSRNALLIVADFPPAFKEKLPANLNLTEGDKLCLKAKISGKPVPEVKWLKDGKALRPSSKISSTVLPDGTVELLIPEVTHTDAGTYRLVANNPKGHADSETNVAVGFAEKQMKPFVSQLHPVDVVVGATVVLEAKVLGNPEPEIQWTKDGVPLESNSHFKISREGDKSILNIDPSRAEDSGEYTLTATNTLGKDESSAAVTVSVPGKKPAFTKELKAVKANESEEAKLEVIVTGYPMPTVAWYRNGKNIMEGQRYVVHAEDTGLASLIIHGVASEDGGMYTAMATNKLGKAVSEAPLLVIPSVKTGDTRKAASVFEFIKSLMPQLIPEGQPCTLEARTTTDPKPIGVRWTKDGKEIPPSERLQISNDLAEGVFQLTLPQMSQQDRGKYTVHVSDGASEIKSEALVNMVPSMPGLSGNKPDFLKGLEPLKVGEGETIQLRAQLPPHSGCAIKWMKDGDDVSPSDRIQLLEQPNGHIALIVEGAMLQDAGKYVVVASNEHGKTRSTAMVAVVGTGFRLPEIKESLQPASFEQGQPGKLTAKIDGEPKPEIQWLRDGQPILPSERIKMSEDPDGTVSLEISQVLPEDAGKYTLLVSNLGGETRTSAPVEVILAEKQMKPFVSQLHPVDVVVGATVVLEAKVMGNPAPEIQWTKDGVPLESNSHFKISREGDKSILNIDPSRAEDSGEYTLTATNTLGKDESSAAVTVSVPGKKPAFTKELKAVKANESEEAKLEVIVTGYPMPTVAWYRNGKNIMEGQRYVVHAEDTGLASLTIHGVASEDGGMYTAMATNKLGKAVSEAPLLVIPSVKTGDTRKAASVFEFMKSLMPQLIPEGQPCTLEARTTTDPKPIGVRWTKDGKEIPPSERLQISNDLAEGVFQLTLPQMSQQDRGKYTVHVSDGASEIKSEALVNMVPSMPGLSGNKPDFLKGLEPLKVGEGETIQLRAQLPPHSGCAIKWMKDGDDVSPSDRIQILEQPNGHIALIVEGAMLQDAGKYVVVASNEHGKTRSTAMVAVVGTGFRLPEIKESLQPASFEQGQPGKLTAKIDGEPKPEIQWLRDGQPILPSERIKMSEDPDGTVSLEISQVLPEDAGKYTLLVSNLGGETRTSAPVEVIRAPLFLKPLQSASGVIDSPANLECKVSGEPVPDITW